MSSCKEFYKVETVSIATWRDDDGNQKDDISRSCFF